MFHREITVCGKGCKTRIGKISYDAARAAEGKAAKTGLADEEEIPDPMAGLKPPRAPDKPVPVFTGEELPQLERAPPAGRSGWPPTCADDRHDYVAVFTPKD